MGSLCSWLEHRMDLVGIKTRSEFTDVWGVGARVIDMVFALESFASASRSSLRWLGRALKCSIGDLQAVEAGEWVSDDRLLDFDKPVARRNVDEEPHIASEIQDGLPLIGTIEVSGAVIFDEYWDAEFGRRHPMRYKRNGWRYALETSLGASVFEIAGQHELRAGEMVIVQVGGEIDARGIYGRLLIPNNGIIALRMGDGEKRPVNTNEIVRVSRELKSARTT